MDKKIVGKDIVPKVLELSFENDTIRNTVRTVPTLFRYIGNDNDKTITKRQCDKKDTRLPKDQEIPGTTQVSYFIQGTTCVGSLPSGKGIR